MAGGFGLVTQSNVTNDGLFMMMATVVMVLDVDESTRAKQPADWFRHEQQDAGQGL